MHSGRHGYWDQNIKQPHNINVTVSVPLSCIVLVFLSNSFVKKMAQLAKFIVGELNKPPFNLNLTLVSFNALQPPQLLQVSLWLFRCSTCLLNLMLFVLQQLRVK